MKFTQRCVIENTIANTIKRIQAIRSKQQDIPRIFFIIYFSINLTIIHMVWKLTLASYLMGNNANGRLDKRVTRKSSIYFGKTELQYSIT